MKNFKKKEKNSSNGITLIALVITIIVLLILAGISINMLTGDNNILTKAGEAKTTYEESEFKEQLQIEVLGNYSSTTELNATTLKENIEKNIDNSNVTNNELPLIVKNTKTNTVYLIDTDGTVMLYDENAVARIKDKFYATLQLAINAVPTDNTKKEIILLKDDVENVSIPANTNIILNLNNKTLSNENNTTIAVNGTLTIKDGTVRSKEKHAIYNWKDLTIEGTETYIESMSTNVGCLVNYSNAKLTINDGTISAKGSKNAIYNYANGETIINNGNITSLSSYAVDTLGKLTINGGRFYSKDNITVNIGESSNVEINKGNFSSDMVTSSDYWKGTITTTSSGTLKIGNIGDDDNNIIINNNNNKICGIWACSNNNNIVINSGTIKGFWAINADHEGIKIYLNGGIITGNGVSSTDPGAGYAINIKYLLSSANIYLKKISSIALSGHGYTGKNAIRNQEYLTEVD